MGQISLALSEILVLAGLASSGASVEPAPETRLVAESAPGEGQPARPGMQLRGPVPKVSHAERDAVQKYRRCVITTLKYGEPIGAKPSEVPLLALYSCPTQRSDAQRFLIEKYGYSHKQKLFNALDQRLLEELRAVAASARPARL